MTKSRGALLASGSWKVDAFFTEKLRTDSLVSCCRRPNATRGATSPCTAPQLLANLLGWLLESRWVDCVASAKLNVSSAVT